MKTAPIIALRTALKIALGTVATVATFLLLKSALGNPSSAPQSIRDAYPPSFLARRGLEGVGYLGLIVAVLLHFAANARRLRGEISARPVLFSVARRGMPIFLLLGFFYGCMWFVAFLELGFAYYPRMEARCVLSGIRDFLTLTASGLLFSLLFKDRGATGFPAPRGAATRPIGGDLAVVPCAALGFFSLHLLQYRLAFVSVPAHPRSVGGLVWLSSFSLLVGASYYLFAGNARRPLRCAADFFLNVFGLNWLLYNLFYEPTLAIPLWEVVLRSGAGVAGGLLGAFAYYLARRAINWWRVFTPSFR